MIPIVRTYRRNPAYLTNILNDEYCGGKMETFNQKVNVIENENNFIIDLIAPGYDRSEIKVAINKNELTIASETSEPKKKEAENNTNYLRKEFIKKPFSRTFELPENAEAEKIEATHTNGILSITIPKKAKVEIPVTEIKVK